MEQLIEQLPEDQQIAITRIFAARQKNKSTQLWCVQVGKIKKSGPSLLEVLAQVRDQFVIG